nr:glycine zipper domain-containing protein [Gordonia jinhuaensis]
MSELIAVAGVDPWDLDDKLSLGRPADIDALANAYHSAGSHVGEADAVFAQARDHFRGAYRAHGTDDTINESSEVRSVTRKYKLKTDQLKQIGTDLEQIAGALADSQNAARGAVATLNSSLEQYDEVAGSAELTNAQLDNIKRQAEEELAAVGHQVKSAYDAYERMLIERMRDIRDHGDKSEGDAKNNPYAGPAEGIAAGIMEDAANSVRGLGESHARHSAVALSDGERALLIRGGKVVARAGVISDLAITSFDSYRDWHDGNASWEQAVGEGVGSVAGGAAAGALTGAAVGSFAGPIGTAVGAGIGAFAGSTLGKSLGKEIGGWFD